MLQQLLHHFAPCTILSHEACCALSHVEPCTPFPGRATEKILARARQLVDVKKEDGFSALHLAALNNHRDVAEILIKEVSGRSKANTSECGARSEIHQFGKTSKLLSCRDAATSTSGTTATRRRCSWQWHRDTLTWCSCWWLRAPTSTWRTRTATPPCTLPSYARSWPTLCSAPPWRPAALKTVARVLLPRRCTAGWVLRDVC